MKQAYISWVLPDQISFMKADLERAVFVRLLKRWETRSTSNPKEKSEPANLIENSRVSDLSWKVTRAKREKITSCAYIA